MIANVNEVLRGKGISIKADWLEQCLEYLSHQESNLADNVFKLFLDADLYEIGLGHLPPNVSDIDVGILNGLYVLQVDEVVNVCASANAEVQNPDGGNRLLKMCVTDGKQQLIGIEHRRVPTLSTQLTAGTKIVVYDVHVRLGTLLLSPLSLRVLGGSVSRLAALQAAQPSSQVPSTQPPPQPQTQIQPAIDIASSNSHTRMQGQLPAPISAPAHRSVVPFVPNRIAPAHIAQPVTESVTRPHPVSALSSSIAVPTRPMFSRPLNTGGTNVQALSPTLTIPHNTPLARTQLPRPALAPAPETATSSVSDRREVPRLNGTLPSSTDWSAMSKEHSGFQHYGDNVEMSFPALRPKPENVPPTVYDLVDDEEFDTINFEHNSDASRDYHTVPSNGWQQIGGYSATTIPHQQQQQQQNRNPSHSRAGDAGESLVTVSEACDREGARRVGLSSFPFHLADVDLSAEEVTYPSVRATSTANSRPSFVSAWDSDYDFDTLPLPHDRLDEAMATADGGVGSVVDLAVDATVDIPTKAFSDEGYEDDEVFCGSNVTLRHTNRLYQGAEHKHSSLLEVDMCDDESDSKSANIGAVSEVEIMELVDDIPTPPSSPGFEAEDSFDAEESAATTRRFVDFSSPQMSIIDLSTSPILPVGQSSSSSSSSPHALGMPPSSTPTPIYAVKPLMTTRAFVLSPFSRARIRCFVSDVLDVDPSGRSAAVEMDDGDSLAQMTLSSEVLSSFLGDEVMGSDVIYKRLLSGQGIFWVDKIRGPEMEPGPPMSLVVLAYATGTLDIDRDQEQETFKPSQSNTLSSSTIGIANLCRELK